MSLNLAISFPFHPSWNVCKSGSLRTTEELWEVRSRGLISIFILSTISCHLTLNLFHFSSLLKFCFFRIFSLDCVSQPFLSSFSSLLSYSSSHDHPWPLLSLSPFSPSLFLSLFYYSFSWTQILYFSRWCSDSNAVSVSINV